MKRNLTYYRHKDGRERDKDSEGVKKKYKKRNMKI
jgi:hypothetical protein